MSKSFEIVRGYAKRETEKSEWHGQIGSATLRIESKSDIAVTLDGKELGVNSITHLLNFALQTLQDAYAGAGSLEEAKGLFTKKRDAILNGTIGVRQSGDGESEETRIARRIIGEQLKAKFKGTDKWAKFTELSDAERNAKLDELVAKNRAAIADEIAAEVERLRKMREAKAKRLNVETTLDL